MKNAFTLVETVITLALIVLIMTAIISLYIVYGRAFVVEQAGIEVGLGASAIIDAMRLASLPADHVVASHTFAGTTLYSSATTTIFELPAIQSSGAVIVGSYDYIGIYALGTAVYRVTDVAAGSARPSGTTRLTNVLNAILFTYSTTTSFAAVTDLSVSATTSEMVHEALTQTHLAEHLYLRNI